MSSVTATIKISRPSDGKPMAGTHVASVTIRRDGKVVRSVLHADDNIRTIAQWASEFARNEIRAEFIRTDK